MKGEVYVLGRATDCIRLKSGRRVYLFDMERTVLREVKATQCKVLYIQEVDEILVNLVLSATMEDEFLYENLNKLCKEHLGEEQAIRYKCRKHKTALT